MPRNTLDTVVTAVLLLQPALVFFLHLSNISQSVPIIGRRASPPNFFSLLVPIPKLHATMSNHKRIV
jgi:hypothetical protein